MSASSKSWHEAGIDAVAVDEGAEASVVFDAAAFADAQEDDAVDNALDREVQFALGKLGVAEGEVAGKVGAPGLDGLEKLVVNIGGAALGFGGFGELVEGTFEDGVPGEDAGNFIPALGILACKGCRGCGQWRRCACGRA